MDARRSITAQRGVPVAREELYARLADLRGHWELAGGWVEPVELRADGGTVRVRGPFGLRRTVHTRLTDARPPERVVGEARIGSTLAVIRWELGDDGGSRTIVTLIADVVRARATDRALLALGGRRWLARRFRDTLQRLG